MVQWLLSLPKNIFVIVVLGAAILFIVVQDPPHTICRTQINNFKAQQKGILYKDPKIKTRVKPLIKVLIENCKKYNTPGSCYALFSRTKKLIKDFKVVSRDCREPFASLGAVKEALFGGYSLIIRIAWGDTPPLAHQDKLNWLSDIDVSLFCLIKEEILFYYGKEALLNLEKKVFKKLPGAKNMKESRIRELSLTSENCSLYPIL
ncbi:MAG: hypothetical protein F4X95_03890 [Oligoflexia bacterium]|nr:hypothetical protein [Bdellovibrionales bacterium]MYE07874.1 hypothetical protein [Oligoflexia bacterium]